MPDRSWSAWPRRHVFGRSYERLEREHSGAESRERALDAHRDPVSVVAEIQPDNALAGEARILDAQFDHDHRELAEGNPDLVATRDVDGDRVTLGFVVPVQLEARVGGECERPYVIDEGQLIERRIAQARAAVAL